MAAKAAPNGPNGSEPEAAGSALASTKTPRKQVYQSDVPAVPLGDAVRVPRAMADQYAGSSVTPFDLARALQMQPNGGTFRMIVGASAAYGLTDGGAWADTISLTMLGRKIVKPQVEGEDEAASREAFLKPRVIGEFLRRYDNGKIPREDIALNVLEGMGVPSRETKRVFAQILADARSLGLIASIKGSEYFQLRGVGSSAFSGTAQSAEQFDEGEERENTESPFELVATGPGISAPSPAATIAPAPAPEAKRIYLAHGKNRTPVESLKKALKLVEMEAVVSVERESTSIPVPEKVISDMRRCGAAIIHVDAERTVTDQDGSERVTLNENVLIEIGVAMAIYGKRFILLVKDGVTLPSNLQGLYQVIYSGDEPSMEAMFRLLEAVAEIKSHPMPGAQAS